MKANLHIIGTEMVFEMGAFNDILLSLGSVIPSLVHLLVAVAGAVPFGEADFTGALNARSVAHYSPQM